jgi:hypothetical protein
MPQIHEVQVFDEKRYEIDPHRGAVLKHDKVLKRGTTAALDYPGHGVFEVSDDGSFEVPDEVADYYTSLPDWDRGPNPFKDEIEAEAAKAKPTRKPTVKK